MNSLQSEVISAYNRRFNGKPLLVSSPGRVNLIGEHTDYNNGFVLPAAIDKSITLAISKNPVKKIRLHSVDMNDEYIEIPVARKYQKTGVHWADYVIGVVDQLASAGHYIEGFDCAFGGDVPIGAGLSSSAALENGVVFGLSKLFDIALNLKDMARIAMSAENNFVGMQCGIMDQFASLHGKRNSVIKLDCKTLDFEYFPFAFEDVCILLCDTRVRRSLTGSDYNTRRQECELGVHILSQFDPSVQSLRDVSGNLLQQHKYEMFEVIYRRCKYVLDENRRVEAACNHLMDGNLREFGARMYESHYGLRDDYEVSCKELDVLVEITEKLDDVLGARMMGGGFGGCTINLVKRDNINQITDKIRSEYANATGKDPLFHVVNIGSGTHVLEMG